MEGVPGVAKTLLVRTLAGGARVGHQAGAVHPRPDARRHHRLDGRSTARPGELTFREGPVFTNLLLADEINRTPPKTQSALLEAMEEGQVSVDGVSRPLPRPFLVAATQNPVEYEGTYPLPEAQLDRFLLKVVLPMPDRATTSWRSCAGTPTASTRATSPAAGRARGRRRRRHRRRRRPPSGAVQVSPEVAGYIVDIARATRESPVAEPRRQPARRDRAAARPAGPGPGCSGRDFVTPDDVKALAQRDPGAPARAAPRGRARGRRRRPGARSARSARCRSRDDAR